MLNAGVVRDVPSYFPPAANRNEVHRYMRLRRLILQHFTVRHPAHRTGWAVLEKNYQLFVHETGVVFDGVNLGNALSWL